LILFQCFNSHITNVKIISAAEKALKLFQNYFSDIEHVVNYSRAATILWNNFETILFYV